MKTIIKILIVLLCVSCNSKTQNIGLEIEFITPLKKIIDSKNDVTDCKTWTIDEKTVNKLIKNMKQVNQTEKFALCYDYPCYYTAEVKYKGQQYTLIVNSASYIELINGKKNLFFILEEVNDHFLIPCNCCDNE